MEIEVLKAICDSQGAVNTEYLMYNLGLGAAATEIIRNPEKFALCCPYGQPKVVARTALRLCKVKDCVGLCQGLHLCKNYLFCGSCQYSQTRRGCHFSHALDSAHNLAKLREHELESLSRTELCTLLLQNDNTILPPICFDYNNSNGCKEGDSCKRMHICEKHLNTYCSCFRSHDFNDPQPLKSLREKGVPDTLMPSLKSAYANKSALRFHDKKADGGNCSGASNIDARGRGRGGNRGNRGNRGKRGGRGKGGNRSNPDQQQRISSTSDISSVLDDLDLDNDFGFDASDGNIFDGDSGYMEFVSAPLVDNIPTVPKGKGGNHGNNTNNQPLHRASSTHAIFGDINTDTTGNGKPNRNEKPRPVRDKTDICMYFIKGHCKHEDKCFKAHDKMPYRWQVKENDEWTALPDNEKIEEDYCDPGNSYSSTSPPVHFDTMTCGQNKVRRISTINSLKEPTFIHTTEWLWYWEDEFGKWNMYASASGGHKAADMGSADFEQKFLDNDKDVVEFTAGFQTYSLSFQDMIQTNKKYGTKRIVKRRPMFVSAAEVKNKKLRPRGQPSLPTIPTHWDMTQIPDKGYKRVALQQSSGEFQVVEALFCKTMRGYDIVKIERIQNKGLWEGFQWQRNQMKSNTVPTVAEKKLFHGTDSKYVDVICHHNFDWRICGTHGTAFGKGSYFARDARYSHDYTSDTDVRSMFIARVLVGDYTTGSPNYVRPPSKDGGDINFYDSCVNNVLDPSIFVIFKEQQIYPEYLLQYKRPFQIDPVFGAAVAPAPAPAPKPVTKITPVLRSAPTPKAVPVSKPAPAPAPRTSSIQPGYTSYQPSTSSSQQTTSSTLYYNNRTGSYQYRPLQTNPPAPPTPPSKKNACVIA